MENGLAFGLAELAPELLEERADLLHRCVPEADGFQHLRFADLRGARLHHDHVLARAGDDEIEV